MLNRYACCALGLLSVSIPAFAQAQPPGDDDGVETPYVMVFAEPQLRGDVRFLLAPSGFPQPPDLVGILRNSLGCDWRTTLVTPRVAQGTCRHLLHAGNGSVRDTLNLAPLGAALRRAGAREISFSLAAQGKSLGDGGNDWIRGSVGRTADAGSMADITNWRFVSYEDDDLPPAFAAEVGSRWSFRRLITPLVLVLSGPFLLALWVRRRMLRTGAGAGAGGIWLNWILLGAWLYWITVVTLQDLIGFANALDTDQWLVTLILGTILFCGPPLAAVALCAHVLVPALNQGESESGNVWRVLRIALAGEAQFMVPLSLFLMGTALVPQEFKAGLTSLLLAFGAYRILTFCLWRWSFRNTTLVVSGPLYDRAMEIAKSAGVKLAALHLVETRSPMEANAYASPGGSIAITRSLVDNLSRREVDTVLGHEIGHSRGNSSWWRIPFLLFYIFVGGPAIARFAAQAGLPACVLDLPIIPLLYVMATGWISQRQELLADARAATVTNDPEACIAALASLARVTKSPTEWKGMQGSILSHPSMRTRVLALAKRSGVAETRALELLHHPDTLLPEGTEKEYYPLPEWLEARQPVFNPTVRHAYLYWANWIFGGSLIGLLVAVYATAMAMGLPHPLRVAWLASALPFVAIAATAMDEQYARGFMRIMRRRIEARLRPRPGGTFAALLPGDKVGSVAGVYAWDLGHLYLDGNRLTFQGERVQFSVDPAEIQSVSVVSGPLSWFRQHAALVRSASGAFSLRIADRGSSRRLARQLTQRILAWKDSAATGEAPANAAGLVPKLTQVRIASPPRIRLVWHFGKTAVLIVIGAWLATAVAVGYAFATWLVPIAAALIYLIVVSPTVLRE
jgi:Zn-dependent protease with chaperone function